MRAIIIDDEKSARDTLKSDIVHSCPEVTIVAEANGVKTGIAAIKEFKPDLVFLDVEMMDGNGFDILEQLHPAYFKVIFTTAYDTHAVKAFKFSAVDYLLKPVDTDELIAAVKKLNTVIDTKGLQMSLNALIENSKNNQKELQKIVINSSDGHYVFSIDEIIRFEADRNYTKVVFEKEKPLLVAKTLKHFEDLLKGQKFERIHQSHIINVRHIKKYIPRDGGYVVMSNTDNVPVAQRKRAELLELLELL
jgi:two-component system, LytTR family, response regulator